MLSSCNILFEKLYIVAVNKCFWTTEVKKLLT